MDTPTNQPTQWQRTTTRRFLKWFFSARVLGRSLLAFACLITLIALFYAEENWRGKRAWENFKREWEAKGESFDPASLIPPPVPDDQNFFMTPLFAPIAEYARLRYEDRSEEIKQRFEAAQKRLGFDLYPNVKYVSGGKSPVQQPPRLGSWPNMEFTDLPQ